MPYFAKICQIDLDLNNLDYHTRNGLYFFCMNVLNGFFEIRRFSKFAIISIAT